jgi:hypothetical protein
MAADLGVTLDELGPSLTSAQLMATPFTDRNLPDLSVSNEALLASLRPAADNDLGSRASRLARTQGERALYWFGTRPSWLQATLSVAGGSLVGLGLVVAYAKTFHAPPPAVAAEPVGPARGVALAAAAAPAALIAQRVVRPLSPAPTANAASAATPAVAAEPPAADPPTAEAVADDTEAGERDPASDAAPDPTSEPRKSKRQRVSKSASSGKLPSWVQQSVKPQAQRLAAREKKAALREKRAAALREKKSRRARAKARAQE